jgi:hypothetical protein
MRAGVMSGQFVHSPNTVPCPRCLAAALAPCVSRGEPIKSIHVERREAADERNAEIESNRYMRSRDKRRGAAPRLPQPCGTYAAARRHQYHKEPLDEACREAIRAYQRNTARERANRPYQRGA